MSETANAAAAPPALPLTMNLQYTKDLSFEVPAGAEIFATLRSNPQISVNIDVQANRLQQDQAVFEIVLAIKTEATEPANDAGTAPRVVFIAELAYAAVVTLNEVPDTMIEPLLLVEVPRLIFPYARNIISEVTRDGGFPPVVLQPIDFVSLWQAKRGQNNAAQVSTQTGHA
ncbi:protein-export chaperone SecB [Lichenicoccus sp.]|uniref:protein-export chaperone SecB n=1 Tax=Lichenicoccus sp. TaxID=2781899 RepID=UPI003D0A81E8